MMALLSPRVWIALALVAFLAFTHLTAYRKGKQEIRNEWTLATAQANEQARLVERASRHRVDEAARVAAASEARDRAAAAGARRESDGLRDDLRAANDYARQSRAAAERVASLATELLGRCHAQYLGMAEAAARADREARELRQGWPK